MHAPLRLAMLSLLAAASLALLAALAACNDASSGDGGAETQTIVFEDGLPVVSAVRVVCRLASDTPGARVASITGADGSQSIAADGRSYWFFGDTVRATGDRQEVIPAAIATTTDTDASDCLDLEFKTAPDGVVTAMFPRLDETTAWPDGVLALDDESIAFYMVKAYRQSPFSWHVGSVGLGRIPAGSTDGERVVETIWDENSGFGTRVAGVRSPVRVGGDVVVYLALEDRRNVVARAPVARMAQFAAYTYWDGHAWSADPADAAAMWESPETGFPPDNGVQVSFDDTLGKWVAVYNDGMASVKVRLAEDAWGPWSAPVGWFACRPLVQDIYPYCYTGELHRHLAGDGGRTHYMTIASQKPYDVSLIELHMASPIREWRGADGALRYAAESPGTEYADEGVAFYASMKPAPGLTGVYEQPRAGGFRYTISPVDGALPVFYAYSTAGDGTLATVAMREVDGALTTGGSGDVRFFVPCPVAACEESLDGE